MPTPLDSYAPGPEGEPPYGPPGGEPLPWLKWLQLAVTSALLVLVFGQAVQLQDANRKIAQLFSRLDMLDQKRLLDTSPTLEAQQRTILERLEALEATIKDVEIERGAVRPSGGAAALQPPPPPRLSP
ncbi:MAG: hypothetical protein VKO44_02480 [Cyanobacteriota bacterium]|jgi:hypothetical protein|nr:hypothetical protein [Cyanobacteriota bacterium]